MWRRWIGMCLACVRLMAQTRGGDELRVHLDFPSNRLVFQRDRTDGAIIPVKGRSTRIGAEIDVRFVALDESRTNDWIALGRTKSVTFNATVWLAKGWYRMETRIREGQQSTVEKGVDRVGVGEVFVVMGHSVAQGGGLNLPGAMDDRVQTISLDQETLARYEKTGNPADLPSLGGVQFGDGVKPAPFGHGPYFWAQFAGRLAKREKVPVLLLNAGFGGTSLAHWAESARGLSFEHSFVRSEIRMPYINLRNAFWKYASVLGLRALLSDQGQNDWPEKNSDVVYDNYRLVIEQARKDLGYPKLAVIVNRQTPGLVNPQIRRAQERVIREIPFCYTGPDYDQLAPEDRPDNIHLGLKGMEKAAQLWTDAVSSESLWLIEPFAPSAERH